MDSTFNKVKESLAKFDLKAYEAMTDAKETLINSLASIIKQNAIYFLPEYCNRDYWVDVYEILEITQHVICVEISLDEGFAYKKLSIPIELITNEAKLNAVVAEKEKEKEQERRKAEEKRKVDKEERDRALYLELKRKYEPESIPDGVIDGAPLSQEGVRSAEEAAEHICRKTDWSQFNQEDDMTEFQILKDNLPKVDMLAYSEARESIQRILRQYRKFFLGRRERQGILFVDGINIISDEWVEVFVSCYKSDGKLRPTDLVALDRRLITDEEKLKKAIHEREEGEEHEERYN